MRIFQTIILHKNLVAEAFWLGQLCFIPQSSVFLFIYIQIILYFCEKYRQIVPRQWITMALLVETQSEVNFSYPLVLDACTRYYHAHAQIVDHHFGIINCLRTRTLTVDGAEVIQP